MGFPAAMATSRILPTSKAAMSHFLFSIFRKTN
jgi:hypothetical protein